MPFRWLGPRNGRIEIDGDGETERSPAAQLPPDTHLFPAESRSGYLEPDATLIGGSGEDLFAVLIEYDRTERPHKQIDRLRRYDHWLLGGWRRGPFAVHAIAPAVIFLTSHEGPLNRLIETADETFSASYGGEHTDPHEDTYPARERVQFASREHLLAGDWLMRRTPTLPSALREEPAVCEPRSSLPRPTHHRCLWRGQVQSGSRERAGSSRLRVKNSNRGADRDVELDGGVRYEDTAAARLAAR